MLPPLFAAGEPAHAHPGARHGRSSASCVALLAGFVPLDVLADLVSIGTLVAFMRRLDRRDRAAAHRTRPAARLPGARLPRRPRALDRCVCLYLIPGLSWLTLVVFAVWLVVVLLFWVVYGARHSRLARAHGGGAVTLLGRGGPPTTAARATRPRPRRPPGPRAGRAARRVHGDTAGPGARPRAAPATSPPTPRPWASPRRRPLGARRPRAGRPRPPARRSWSATGRYSPGTVGGPPGARAGLPVVLAGVARRVDGAVPITRVTCAFERLAHRPRRPGDRRRARPAGRRDAAGGLVRAPRPPRSRRRSASTPSATVAGSGGSRSSPPSTPPSPPSARRERDRDPRRRRPHVEDAVDGSRLGRRRPPRRRRLGHGRRRPRAARRPLRRDPAAAPVPGRPLPRRRRALSCQRRLTVRRVNLD